MRKPMTLVGPKHDNGEAGGQYAAISDTKAALNDITGAIEPLRI